MKEVEGRLWGGKAFSSNEKNNEETKVVNDTPEDYIYDQLIKAQNDKSLLKIFLWKSKKQMVLFTIYFLPHQKILLTVVS